MTTAARWGLAAALLAGLGATGTQADRGAIVTVGEVDIEEPAQRALIAHNGARELLVLQTDVKASRAVKVVEFMPLPAKPRVSLAPKGCFAALARLIEKHNLRYVVQYRGKDGGGEKGRAVQVVVAEQLGPHAVTVVEVADAAAFTRWVKGFFGAQGLGEPALGEGLRGVVERYLDRDIRFFAFDVVSLGPETQTVRPLAYEFACRHLYYPLEVTNLYGGKGTVELITVLPWGLAGFEAIAVRPRADAVPPDVRLARRLLRSTAGRLRPGEASELHGSMEELLGGQRAILRAVKYEGPLAFAGDVWAPTFYHRPSAASHAFVAAVMGGDRALVAALVDVPFAFDRVEVVEDRDALVERLSRGGGEERRPAIRRRIEVQRAAGSSLVVSDFDKRFVAEHLAGGHVARVTVGREAVVLFLRRTREGAWKVAGLSD
ncbi:MAG: DUF2330 domain-containing protein [bacterium]